jgi:hypothetical protein
MACSDPDFGLDPSQHDINTLIDACSTQKVVVYEKMLMDNAIICRNWTNPEKEQF